MDRSDHSRPGWQTSAPSSAPRVFLSHAPSERDFAARLTEDLRQRGVATEQNPTRATISVLPRLLQSGMPPDWLVVILSPDALWSPTVADEMRSAAELLHRRRLRGALAIIAVPCQQGGIPSDWPIVRTFDATSDYQTAMSQLSAALEAADAPPTAAPKEPEPALPDEATTRLPVVADPADERTTLLASVADPSRQETMRTPATRDVSHQDTVRTPAVDVSQQETAYIPSVADLSREETVELRAQSRSFARLVPASSPPPPSPVSAQTPPAAPRPAKIRLPATAPRQPLISRRTLLGAGAVLAASAMAGGAAYLWRASQKAPPPPGPTVRWRFPLDGRITAAVAEVDGVLYFGTDSGQVYALDAATHSPRWIYTARAGIGQAAPLVDGNSVYISVNDSTINKLSMDLATPSDPPRLIWSFHVRRWQFSPPALADGIAYTVAGFNGLFALDSETGALRWRTKPAFNPTSPPTLADSRIYVAGAVDSAYALDSADGTILWQSPVEGAVYSRMPLVNGVVYVSSLGKAVFALDARTGRQRWRFATAGQVYSSPTVDPALGMVYIGGSDSYLYALDAATGALRWRQQLASAAGTPRLLHGQLYVISGGYLYALHPATGAMLWQYVAGEGAISPLGVGAGALYIGSADGYLYALTAS